jgi:phage terminase small subunit
VKQSRPRRAQSRSAKTAPKRNRPTTKREREAARTKPAPICCSEKELAFIDRWLTHFNGSRAIVDAGIHDNPLVAKVYASEYLKRPHVAAEIAERRRLERSRLEAARERVIAEMLNVSLATIGDVMEWSDLESRMIPKADLSPEQMASISQIQVTINEVVEQWSKCDKEGNEIKPQILHRTENRIVRMHPKLEAGAQFLKQLGPTDEEIAKRTKGGSLGSGGQSATIVINGGPTGLEFTVTAGEPDDA